MRQGTRNAGQWSKAKLGIFSRNGDDKQIARSSLPDGCRRDD
jgi:hypothetical protein